MIQTGYKLLVVYNEIYFYDFKKGEIEIIKCQKDSIKDDKIFAVNSFLKDIKKNEKIKKISSKLVGEKLEILIWENYNDADKRLLKEVFSDLNFSLIEFTYINEYIKSEIAKLIISQDGIHYLAEVGVFYSYESHYSSLEEIIKFIKKKYDLNKFVLIGKNLDLKVLDFDAFMYENNKNFFEDLLKM